ncbi:MAG: hypothetical protein EXX96DRAFT_368617 [Benjaminiella poitrasii]|nr:MAG: hypothetical protein EXX96DRAFT_368617 [Benjaminiella poitrasii]
MPVSLIYLFFSYTSTLMMSNLPYRDAAPKSFLNLLCLPTSFLCPMKLLYTTFMPSAIPQKGPFKAPTSTKKWINVVQNGRQTTSSISLTPSNLSSARNGSPTNSTILNVF